MPFEGCGIDGHDMDLSEVAQEKPVNVSRRNPMGSSGRLNIVKYMFIKTVDDKGGFSPRSGKVIE